MYRRTNTPDYRPREFESGIKSYLCDQDTYEEMMRAETEAALQSIDPHPESELAAPYLGDEDDYEALEYAIDDTGFDDDPGPSPLCDDPQYAMLHLSECCLDPAFYLAHPDLCGGSSCADWIYAVSHLTQCCTEPAFYAANPALCGGGGGGGGGSATCDNMVYAVWHLTECCAQAAFAAAHPELCPGGGGGGGGDDGGGVNLSCRVWTTDCFEDGAETEIRLHSTFPIVHVRLGTCVTGVTLTTMRGGVKLIVDEGRTGYVYLLCTLRVPPNNLGLPAGKTCTASCVVYWCGGGCDCEGFGWDYETSAVQVNPGNECIVAVTGGPHCGPFTWSVSGTGFSLEATETDSPANVLVADETACGTATITVTSCNGGTATGVVLSTEGQWVKHDEISWSMTNDAGLANACGTGSGDGCGCWNLTRIGECVTRSGVKYDCWGNAVSYGSVCGNSYVPRLIGSPPAAVCQGFRPGVLDETCTAMPDQVCSQYSEYGFRCQPCYYKCTAYKWECLG
jgi:hypothetical protein